MVSGWVVLLTAIVYIGILFAVANYGDKRHREAAGHRMRPYLYALSLAIYCTTWTFFGSVGFVASSGLSFIAIYLGPILVITVGFPILTKVVSLSKGQRITSVADFIGARYGKSTIVGAVAALIAVIGTLPYIAVQLKAISASVSTLISHYSVGFTESVPAYTDISLVIAIFMAAFTVLFGTRHADATEHQHGLMLAVAMESVVKLIAFLMIGLFVTYSVFDGIGDIMLKASKSGIVSEYVDAGFDATNFLILTLLSGLVFLLLPRQFHVAIVENRSARELTVARWLFPLYLLVINLFVIPIAIAGRTLFGDSVPADTFVLAIPMNSGAEWVSLIAFIGGLSAGTAMVIVASVALAIMVSNQIVLPIMLKRGEAGGKLSHSGMEQQILKIRRITIVGVILAAYAYYKMADNTAALVSIGLVSFAAIAQLAPSFFAGMYWKKANASGAVLGMSFGFAVWAYTLLLPTLLADGHWLLNEGLFGMSALRPDHLFNLELGSISNGVVCSLAFNALGLVLGSYSRDANAIELMQASLFVKRGAKALPIKSLALANLGFGDLIDTVAQYLGIERSRRAFEAYQFSQGAELDVTQRATPADLQFSEQLLASAVGASSSRLVHGLLIRRHDKDAKISMSLLDEASHALQYNRGVMQSALDQIEHGICVLDDDYQLSSWNQQFRSLLNLPVSVGTAGTSFTHIIEKIVSRNRLGSVGMDASELAKKLASIETTWQLELPDTDRVLEVGRASVPQGGSVYTWNDITEKTRSAEALREANESLERRVEERTAELTKLNFQLAEATQDAKRANLDKTRFLAAVGHDILQPLNAARLYCATLLERLESNPDQESARSVNRSLNSVEEILGAVLAISRLDTGKEVVVQKAFDMRSLFEQLHIEFKPVADEKGLELRMVETSLYGHTEPALFKRLLQNLISNSIKYSNKGCVLVGCRRKDQEIGVQILDTGVGIEPGEQVEIFKEFKRLNASAKSAPGLGLGLSIVERISKRLDLKVELQSVPGHGTAFTIWVPMATETQRAKLNKKKKANRISRPIVATINPGLHVLCVDNNENILDGMKGLLEQWNCKVTTATGSADALKKYAGTLDLPDVILMDYHLDGEDGLEAAGVLRDGLKADFDVVLVTAERSNTILQQARDAGLEAINKPIKPAALRSVLSSLARTRQAAE